MSSAWHFAASGAVMVLGLSAVRAGIERGAWPFAPHAAIFLKWALVPLLALAMIWTLWANVKSDGDPSPFIYLPVVNPLDLAQLALFVAAFAAMRPKGPAPEFFKAWPAIAVGAFFWVNAAVLRTVHHWSDVPYRLDALLHSVVAQAALSLLWTATALVMMFAAGKRKSRNLWMAGAAVLAVVIAKLFLNDLNNTGTVARIVSFIGVGVFMLVIGYLSPVPPRRDG
jgi:uncharacterized membrane protein